MQGAIYSNHLKTTVLVDAHLYLVLLGGHLDDMRGYQLDLHTFTCPGDVACGWVPKETIAIFGKLSKVC